MRTDPEQAQAQAQDGADGEPHAPSLRGDTPVATAPQRPGKVSADLDIDLSGPHPELYLG